ncbi:MAG: SH3 domain-containing protein [Candidatus Glassbacteria bacterium]|nr:SH3 domain-containing protein [Candidatus Glassbacteria bacterium]
MCGTLKRLSLPGRGPLRAGVFLAALVAVPLFVRQGFAAETRKLTVIQETAPLFKEPSIRSSIIKYLEKGSELNLLAVQDSFYLVSYGGYEGWVIPFSVEGDLGELEDGLAGAEDSTPGAATLAVDLDLASGRYLVVANRYANIREGPGLNYKLIGRVYQGDKLEKFIKRGRWYRVRLPDSKIGFIREDLVADPAAESFGDDVPEEVAEPADSPLPADQSVSLRQKVDRLEREVAELRRLLDEHIRQTRALLVEMQRSKTGLGQSGLMDIAPAGLDLTSPASIQSKSVKGKIIGNTATRIYHLPESIFYDKIPEEFRVYFDTEEQARTAGYVKSIK